MIEGPDYSYETNAACDNGCFTCYCNGEECSSLENFNNLEECLQNYDPVHLYSDAIYDDCEECSLGNSGHIPNEQDCLDLIFNPGILNLIALIQSTECPGYSDTLQNADTYNCVMLQWDYEYQDEIIVWEAPNVKFNIYRKYDTDFNSFNCLNDPTEQFQGNDASWCFIGLGDDPEIIDNQFQFHHEATQFALYPEFNIGTYAVSIEDTFGNEVAAGIYIYTLESKDLYMSRKMILMK